MTLTLSLDTEFTAAWLSDSNTRAGADELPALLNSLHAALHNLSSAEASQAQPTEEPQQYTPAVSARKSLASPDHIFSMVDEKPYKTLRRHLARHGLTPGEYRQRYGLKRDYPMVSPGYSEVRRGMAQKIGLGRKAGGNPEPEQAEPAPEAKPARTRRRTADAEAA